MNNNIRKSLNLFMADITWKENNRTFVLDKIKTQSHCTDRIKAPVLIAFAFILALSIATALAATSVEFNTWLYQFWPEIALKLMPVNLTCDNQGFRMEVISAYEQDSEVYLTFSIQDLKGNRINDLTAIAPTVKDGEKLKSYEKMFGSYDPEQRRIIFGAEYILPTTAEVDQLTVSLDTLWLGEHFYANLTPYYQKHGSIDRTMPVPDYAVVLGPYHDTGLPSGIRLIDSDCNISIPLCDSVYLTGIGMIDGQLHVQIHYKNNVKQTIYDKIGITEFYPDYGWLFVNDTDGNSLYTGDLESDAISIVRWGGASGEYEPEWEEFFFTVDPARLKTALISIDIRRTTPCKGNWEVRIPWRLIK